MSEPIKCTREVMKTCKYCTTFNNSHCDTICEYILITGHRRPCPPEACTVYKKVTDKERTEQRRMRKMCYGKNGN